MDEFEQFLGVLEPNYWFLAHLRCVGAEVSFRAQISVICYANHTINLPQPKEYQGKKSTRMYIHDLEQTTLAVGVPATLAPHRVGPLNSRNPRIVFRCIHKHCAVRCCLPVKNLLCLHHPTPSSPRSPPPSEAPPQATSASCVSELYSA